MGTIDEHVLLALKTAGVVVRRGIRDHQQQLLVLCVVDGRRVPKLAAARRGHRRVGAPKVAHWVCHHDQWTPRRATVEAGLADHVVLPIEVVAAKLSALSNDDKGVVLRGDDARDSEGGVARLAATEDRRDGR